MNEDSDPLAQPLRLALTRRQPLHREKMRAAILLATSALAQEQMHLSVTGTAHEMALDFVASATATGVAVALDGAPVPADCVTATINEYTAQFCTALFTGLAPNTQHSYTVKSSAAVSPLYKFNSGPAGKGGRAPIFAMYADFGLNNDLSLSALIKDSQSGGFDYVVHAGDWA